MAIEQTAWSLPQALSVLFSGVSMVVILGATWQLATTIATIKAKLEALASIPARVAVLERDVAVIQKDMNNLWQAFREDCADQHGIPQAFASFLEELDKKRAAHEP